MRNEHEYPEEWENEVVTVSRKELAVIMAEAVNGVIEAGLETCEDIDLVAHITALIVHSNAMVMCELFGDIEEPMEVAENE